MLLTFTEWYGGDLYCLTCGDSWQTDDDCWRRTIRPFRRNWRPEAVASTKRYLARLRSGEKAGVPGDQ